MYETEYIIEIDASTNTTTIDNGNIIKDGIIINGIIGTNAIIVVDVVKNDNIYVIIE
jgi:hypothetical protein